MSWIDPLPDEADLWRTVPLESSRRGGAKRDVTRLPETFRQALVDHYLDFAVRCVKRTWHAVQGYLPDRVDMRQQCVVWLLEAATTYDPDRVPFAGYLAKTLPHRPIDLSRSVLGRSAADGAIRLARARRELADSSTRLPTLGELARALDEPVATITAWERVITAASYPRSLSAAPTLEEFDPAHRGREQPPWHAVDPSQLIEERWNESAVLRAVVLAGIREDGTGDPAGVVAFLLTAYGEVTKTALAAAAGLPFRRLTRRMAALSLDARALLNDR